MLNTTHKEIQHRLRLLESEAQSDIKTIRIAVVYHADCNDGIMSAAIVLDYLKINLHNYAVDLYACQYGEECPEDLYKTKGLYQATFIVDFSFKGDVLDKICHNTGQVFVFDHHATPIKNLQKHYEDKSLPENLFMILTQVKGKSGANLTWEHLFPNKTVPDIVQDVADRDTWQFERKTSKDTHLGLLLLEDKRTPEYILENLLSGRSSFNHYTDLLKKGKVANNMWQFVLRDLAKTTFKTSIYDDQGAPTNCWVTNCSYMFTSDLADVIPVEFPKEFDPQTDIMCMMVVREKDVKLSFRSKNKQAQKFAEQLGGGGHPDSAGVENISLDQLKDIFECF